MKAFVKIQDRNRWIIEEDQNKILDAENCCFAHTAEEAVEYINVNFNSLYPDFDIVHANSTCNIIYYSITPRLRSDVSVERAIELIKEKKRIYIKDEIGAKELAVKIGTQLDIKRHGNYFTYKEEKWKPRPPRKYFIRMWQIETVNWNIQFEINKGLKTRYPLVDVKTRYCYGNNTKILSCKKFFSLKDCFDDFFGKYSYRHIFSFQELKDSWKKEKPKSAVLIGVTGQFFNFMEEEIKKRKPRKKEFKLKWK